MDTRFEMYKKTLNSLAMGSAGSPDPARLRGESGCVRVYQTEPRSGRPWFSTTPPVSTNRWYSCFGFDFS